MQSNPISVVCIEDDPSIQRLLTVAFQGDKMRMFHSSSAAEGIDLVVKKRPDLVLLDMGLPDMDGLKVIETIRGWSKVPIIIVSALGDEDRKVKALEAGADDYVTKPFGINELSARIGVALRHSEALAGPSDDEAMFEAGDLRIDRAGREVWVRNERIKITPTEYKLLLTLAKYAGKVVTHRQLLSEVWGSEYSEEAQYLRVYMGYLRKKVEADPQNPVLLLNEPRVGYRLAV